jgi:DNA-binding XRE family transcriptional regulator
MKYDETPLLQAARMTAAAGLRQRLRELRQAYRLQQADVAARAGLSRSTVVLIEKGDPGRTMGQILRYLNAIAPAVTLHALLEGRLLALTMLRSQERTQRFASPQ